MSEAERIVQWIKTGLARRGKTKGALAKALNVHQSQVTRILTQDRKVAAEEVPIIEGYLGIEAPGRETPTVPLVGFVGAGAEANFFSDGQGPFGPVDAPSEVTPHTVAVEVRGDSMPNVAEHGWLLYYDNVQNPIEPGMIGRKTPLIVGLDNGKVLVKKVRNGTLPGHYHLYSTDPTEDPIVNARVVWAARIKWIKPRWDE